MRVAGRLSGCPTRVLRKLGESKWRREEMLGAINVSTSHRTETAAISTKIGSLRYRQGQPNYERVYHNAQL